MFEQAPSSATATQITLTHSPPTTTPTTTTTMRAPTTPALARQLALLARATAAATAALAAQTRQQHSYAQSPLLHHHPPRRAMLYVPGSQEKKLRKAAGELAADSIVMDLEDGVAVSAKGEARHTVARMLGEPAFSPASEAAVRINPAGSALAEDDLRAVLGAARLPDALVVPKVEGVDEVRWVMDRVQQLLQQQERGSQQQRRARVSDGAPGHSGGGSGGGGGGRPMAFIPMCESALALLNLRQTFEAALAHPLARQHLQLQACILGGDDMAASLRATRTAGNAELAHARGAFLLVCRALQVQAIDIVKIDLSEPAGMAALAAEAAEAARAGWSGKQVIHPKQVPVVQAAFSPSAADVEAALALVAAFHEHQGRGHGAFVYEGKMIDAPTVLQARNVLALAERLEQLA